MSDYYIAVNENGQPYIAHAFWNRKGQTKKNYKYIAKEKVGNRFRYFYTQKEWDAFKTAKAGVKEVARTIADKAKELDDKTRGLLAGPFSGVNRYIDEARRDYERTEELAKLYPYDDARKTVRDAKKRGYEDALRSYPSVSEKVRGLFRKDAPAATLTPEGTETTIEEKIIPETIIEEKDLSKKTDDIKINEETMRRSVGGFMDRVKSIPISQIRSPRVIIGSAKIKRAYSKYKKAKETYDKELEDFMEYAISSKSNKSRSEWSARSRKIQSALQRLESATEDLSNAHKKYDDIIRRG